MVGSRCSKTADLWAFQQLARSLQRYGQSANERALKAKFQIRKADMTNYLNSLNSTVVATLLTVVFSATMVVGAVGPAVEGSNVSQKVASALDNVPGKSAHSLA
jgi:hypothetical protein